MNDGHWVYTDDGWYWDSNYEWGWAAFHYGRWNHVDNYNWVWSPDTVWAMPSWVELARIGFDSTVGRRCLSVRRFEGGVVVGNVDVRAGTTTTLFPRIGSWRSTCPRCVFLAIEFRPRLKKPRSSITATPSTITMS